MAMKIKNYLWALPFFSFLAGYFVLERMSRVAQLDTPAIIGKQLQQAVAELSDNNLNLRLIAQKEDPDLPQGTILSQTPAPGQKIKPHQALYVVISKQPEKIAAPLLLNKHDNAIQKELEALGIRNKTYRLPSNRPSGTCIAQLPTPGNQVADEKITTYLSAGNNRPSLVPNLKGKPAPEVLEFLQQYKIEVKIMHSSKQDKNHLCDTDCIISDQRPLAGSLVTLDEEKPLLVQLQVG